MSELPKIVVIPADKVTPSFEVTLVLAKKIVAAGDGIWKGRKTVYLTPDRNKEVTWNVMQSGYAGPLVLQVST